MSDYVHLIGAEQVRQGGNAMQGAAENIRRSVAHLHDSLENFLMRMDELVMRMEAAAEKVSGENSD